MNTREDSNLTHVEECMRLHDCWGWFLALGVLLILVGMLAVGSSFIATMATILLFGWLLIAGGVVQIVNAFVAKNWRGFALHLAAGVLHVVVGAMMVQHPGQAAAFFTLVLAVMFMAGGMVRIIAGIAHAFPGRVWVILNGLVTLVLGVMIWQQWPESSIWVIGLFVGIDLIFNGWTWVMLGLLVKGAGKPQSAGA
jgi:uncharacterized membrane protein HdeD (DUF308 family)